MFNKKIKIKNKILSIKNKPMLVAELSANHNGSFKIAKKTILSAKKNGADAIKFQTYTADTMTVKSTKKDFLISKGLWKNYNLFNLYERAATPWKWQKKLFEYAEDLDILSFSSIFDETSLDFLEKLNVPAYKIPSFEACDLELIRETLQTNKPVIISTGLLNLKEIDELINCCAKQKNNKIILLHCVSSYPAKIEDANLNTIKDLQKKYNALIGLSDHTLTNTAAILSVGLNSVLVEKHFIIDRKIGGPDSSFSIEPFELNKLATDINEAFKSFGSPNYNLKGDEKYNVKFRRSIYSVKDIKKGEYFTNNN